MAKNRLHYDITARDKSKQALRSVQRGLGTTQSAVSRLTRVLAPLAAIFGAGVLGRRLIETNKNFQQLQASLTTFTGSAKNGARAFQILQDFASKTPFSVQEVTASFNILIARGIKPTVAELEAFGDIAAGSGKSFSQFAEAVADAAVGEFERLKEFGIKAGKEKDKVTLAFGGATQTIENNSAAIIKALTGIAKTGFAGATERQAKTLSGAFSNFGDAVDAAAFAIGKQGLNKEINRVTREFSKLITNNKQATRQIGTFLVKALKLAERGLKLVGRNLEQIGRGLLIVFGAVIIRRIANVAKGIYLFTKAVVTSQIAVTIFSKLVRSPKFFALFVGGVAAAAAAIVAFREEIVSTIEEARVFDTISAALSVTQRRLGEALGLTTKDFDDLAAANENMGNQFVFGNQQVDATNKTLTELSDITDNLFGQGALQGAKDYFDGIRDHATIAKDFVKTAFNSLERTLSDFFVSGELSFGNFVDAVKRGLADIAAKGVVSVAGSIASGAIRTVGNSIGSNIGNTVADFIGLAGGGFISGPGSDRSDNIPAMLSPGEFVVNAASVRKYGAGFFGALNANNRGAVDTDSGLPGFGFGSFISKAFKSVTKVIKKVAGFVVSGVKGTVEGLKSGDPMAIAAIVASFILPGVMTAVSAAMSAASAATAFGGVMSAQGLSVGATLAGTAASGASAIATGITNGISNSFAKGILGGQFSASAVGQSLVGGQVSRLATSAVSSALTGGTVDNRQQLAQGLLSSEGETFAKAIGGAFDRAAASAEPFLDRRAGGGPVHSGRPYLVGERGPEVFTPGRAGSVSPSLNASQIVDAVHEVRDEMATLRRQFGRALSGSELAGARA